MNESQVFANVLKRATPAERAAHLDEACAGNPRLRADVEALLRAHAGDPGFLEQPAGSLRGTEEVAPTPGAPGEAPPEPGGTEQPGAVLAGRYKLLEHLGEGGMGTVWTARQTEPVKRLVAVKLIKAGMGSRAVLARFGAERQALALMDHPNIAKVLDAGAAPDGRPFVVMELVQGVPITRFCDEHRLTPRQRLELFVPVCEAVQHAHHKGIIHRDLKPSNVLVALYDGRPAPRVIDFGVAKATGQPLTEQTLHTGFGAVVGTVEYMSPEQASFNQLDVDTRSDVYALGVLLYELLTGSPPFTRRELEKAGMLEVLRLIREQEPPKPSTKLSTADGLPTLAANRGTEPGRLAALVRGELDWIVMKALEKDRNRRYESASAFAADVQRYLNDEPVLACPPSTWYRFHKLVRRNKAGLAVTVLILFFLVMLGGAVGWVARDGAARQLVVGKAVTERLEEADGLQKTGKWPEALEAVQRAEAALVSGTADATLEHQVRERLADLLLVQRLENLRARRSEAGGEMADDAQTVEREYALAFREYGIDLEKLSAPEAAARIPSRPGVAAALAAALDQWAYVRRGRGDMAGGTALTEVALAADPDPFRQRLREAVERRRWQELQQLATSEDLLHQPPTTLVLLGMYIRKLGPGHEDVLCKAQQAYPGDFWINYLLGQVLLVDCGAERRQEAIAYLRCAIAIRPQSSPAHYHLGWALEAGGRHDEAVACFRRAIRLQAESPWPHANLGSLAWLLTVRPKPNSRDATEAVALARKAVELAPQNGSYWLALGAAQCRVGDPQAAVTALQKALTLRNGGNSFDRFFLALAHRQLGHKEEAREWYDQAVRAMDRNRSPKEELRRLRAEAEELLGLKDKK